MAKIALVENQVIPTYNNFDRNFYLGHIIPARYFSTVLAHEIDLDERLCDSAALLHDIGIALHGHHLHNTTSAREARTILQGKGYSDDEVCSITKMIANHSRPYSDRLSLEDQVLRSADAMAQIQEMPYTFFSLLVRNEYDIAQKEARTRLEFAMKEKVSIPIAKQIIAEKYHRALEFLCSPFSRT